MIKKQLLLVFAIFFIIMALSGCINGGETGDSGGNESEANISVSGNASEKIVSKWAVIFVQAEGGSGSGDKAFYVYNNLHAEVAFRSGFAYDLNPENWTEYLSENVEFVEECKEKDTRIWNTISASVLYDYMFDEEFFEDVATRNPQNEKVIWKYEKEENKTAVPAYHGAINDPDWREYLIAMGKIAVDFDSDYIEYDEPNSVYWTLGEDYSDDSIILFNEYLKNKFTDEELNGKFNIENIEEFDYRNYLQENGLADITEEERLEKSPLGKEYIQFEFRIWRDHFGEVAQEVKKYAAEKGKYPTITAHQYEQHPDLLPMSYEVDLISIGSGLFQHKGKAYPYTPMHPLILLTEGQLTQKQTAVFIDSDGLGWLTSHEEAGEKHDSLVKLLFSDCYASNSYFTMPVWSFNYGGDDKLDRFVNYSDFLYNNKELFLNRTRLAEVAVLFSYESYMYESNIIDDYLYTCKGLSENHIQYATILLGDGYVIEDSLNDNLLGGMRAVVVINKENLTENQNQVLENFKNKGGEVIYLGEGGDEARKKLVESLDESLDDRILTTDAPETIAIFAYENREDAITLHLVNFNYSSADDKITPAQNIKIGLETGDMEVESIVVTSPDKHCEMTSVEYEKEGEDIVFTVPFIEIYDIVIIR